MENKIYLENSILMNEKFNQYDIATYVSFKILQYWNKNISYVNSDIILHCLSGTNNYTSKVKNNIKIAINNLVENNKAKICATLSKDIYALDLSSIHIPKDAGEQGKYFTIFNIDEIRTTMNIDCKEDNFKLLRYYLIKISSIDIRILNNNGKKYVGHMSQQYLAEKSNISKTTLRNYNSILEKNKLIYIFHNNNNFCKDNKITSANNIYGRYCDKNDIIKYGISYGDDLSDNNDFSFKRKDKSSSKVESKDDYTTTSTSNVEKKEDNKTKPTSKVSRHSSKNVEYDVSSPFYDDEEITATTSMWDDIFV